MLNLLIVRQAVKFVLVGALNTLVDLGILNLLIFATGIAQGFSYSAFKGISFIVAVVNSYFWNKLWTFRGSETNKGAKEFGQFIIVSVIGFTVNVGAASLIVNLIGNPFDSFGVSDKIWANVGAIAATLCAMSWNFFGYKFIVFKNQ